MTRVPRRQRIDPNEFLSLATKTLVHIHEPDGWKPQQLFPDLYEDPLPATYAQLKQPHTTSTAMGRPRSIHLPRTSQDRTLRVIKLASGRPKGKDEAMNYSSSYQHIKKILNDPAAHTFRPSSIHIFSPNPHKETSNGHQRPTRSPKRRKTRPIRETPRRRSHQELHEGKTEEENKTHPTSRHQQEEDIDYCLSTVLLENKAAKQLRRLDPDTSRRILQALQTLRDQGFTTLDIKKLQGHKNQYRLQVGSHRILFELGSQKTIVVYAIMPRESAY
ncbi:MAG: type II toxin-antitoxin system RelE/ParE family toxin [Thaumarchaeota archaeon]|nr:type II toxin-antitoxin system RelE/ParE family toxin [Nitrososphaerota archaeon]